MSWWSVSGISIVRLEKAERREEEEEGWSGFCGAAMVVVLQVENARGCVFDI